MTTDNPIIEWKFLGRILGTATGWDGEMEAFVLYNFIPAEGIALPPGSLQVEITEGRFVCYDDEGEEIQSFDILTVMGSAP